MNPWCNKRHFSFAQVLLLFAFVAQPALAQQLASTCGSYDTELLSRPRVTYTGQASHKGIYVERPKIFDDRTLQLMLQAAEQRLATLQLIDQTSIAGRIGTLQGGSQVETGLGVQVASLPTPAVTTSSGFNNGTTSSLNQVLSNGVTGTSGTTGTTTTTTNTGSGQPTTTTVITTGGTTGLNTTSGNTTTTNAGATNNFTGSTQVVMPTVNPTLIAPPPESGLSLPTNASVSARDVLNEEMQLTFEIANLRLLLQGSLDDRFTTGSLRVKQHATVGFAISIDPPKDSRYADAVAEIEITVTTPPDFRAPDGHYYGCAQTHKAITSFFREYEEHRTTFEQQLQELTRAHELEVNKLSNTFGFTQQDLADTLLKHKNEKDALKAAKNQNLHKLINERIQSIKICNAYPIPSLLKQAIDIFKTDLPDKLRNYVNDLRPITGNSEAEKAQEQARNNAEAEAYRARFETALTPSALECPDAPGLIAVLPRERTYNVADIRGSSINLAGAVTTQVLTGGVTWFRHTKTFYVVQAQDTVAFEAPPQLPRVNDAANPLDRVSTAFGWRFRPVLGQSRVRAGLRQVFAQLSFQVLPAPESPIYGTATVAARWRKYDKKTGAIGDVITDPDYEAQETERLQTATNQNPNIEWINSWQLPQFDLTPVKPMVVSWEDAGNGLVAVSIKGLYVPGTSVVIGSSLIGPGSPSYFYDPQKIRVLVPAIQLVQTNELELEEQGGKQTLVRSVLDQGGHVELISASARPLTTTDSLVTVTYKVAQQGRGDPHLQPLALIGTTVFGLSDNPITVEDDACMTIGSSSARCKLSFRASTALIRRSRKVKIKQLFFGDLNDPNEQKITFINDSTAQKLLVLAKTDKCTLFAIQGSELAENTVVVRVAGTKIEHLQPTSYCEFSGVRSRQTSAAYAQTATTCDPGQGYLDRSLGSTTLVVAVPKCLLDVAKDIEIFRGDNPEEVQAFLLPIAEEPAAKPVIDSITVKVGQTMFKLTGKHLELIDANGVSFNGVALPAKKADDDSFILVTAPSSFTQQAGFFGISLKRLDGKDPVGALVQVVKAD